MLNLGCLKPRFDSSLISGSNKQKNTAITFAFETPSFTRSYNFMFETTYKQNKRRGLDKD